MTKPFVAILMGSDSNLAKVQPAIDVLKALLVRTGEKNTSAHRTPEITHSYVIDADQRGCGVFICAANGLAVQAKDAELQARLNA